MAEKPTTHRSRQPNRRAADQLAISTRKNVVELREADLSKVSGGINPTKRHLKYTFE